jgi:hypothetical protein
MKKLFAIALAMSFATSLFAQEKIDRERVVKGKMVTAKGDTLDGYIREMVLPTFAQMKYAYENPNTISHADVEFGCEVKFISKKDFDSKKHVHENDYTKCKPEKYKGYVYNYNIKSLAIPFTSLPVKDGKKVKTCFVNVREEITKGEYFVKYYKPIGRKVNIGGFGNTMTANDDDMMEYTHPHEAIYFKDKNEVILVKDIDPVEFYQTRCPEVYDKWNMGTYIDLNRASNAFDKVDQVFRMGKAKIDVAQNEARVKAFYDYLEICAKKKNEQ